MLAGIFDDFRRQMKAHVARRERAIEAEVEERGEPSCEGVIAEANAEVEARLGAVRMDIGVSSALAPAKRDKISYA